MSIDAMTWIVFACLVLTIIFTLLRLRKISLAFAIAALVFYIAANKTFFYLAISSLKELIQK